MSYNESKNIYRVLIVGVSSYLGSALAYGLREHYEVLGTYNEHPIRIEGVTSVPMDCKNGGEIVDIMKRFNPDAVLFCAGIFSKDLAKNDPSMAETINFKAATVFFKVLNVPPLFLYFSTDEVLNTSNIAAKTRLQGENAVLSQRRHALVMRTGKIFGEGTGGLSCLKESWTESLRRRLERGEKVAMASDRLHTFVYLGDVIRATRLVLAKAPVDSALYEICGSEKASSATFGKFFAQAFGFSPDQISEQRSSFEKEDYSLSSAKFCLNYPFKFSTLKEGLQEYAERMRVGTRNWV